MEHLSKEVKLIVKELESRLPKNNKEGFMPDKPVLNALKKVKEYLHPKKQKSSTWLQDN
jgi:hypothetical protein